MPLIDAANEWAQDAKILEKERADAALLDDDDYGAPTWSPFGVDGKPDWPRLADEGFVRVGALNEDELGDEIPRLPPTKRGNDNA